MCRFLGVLILFLYDNIEIFSTVSSISTEHRPPSSVEWIRLLLIPILTCTTCVTPFVSISTFNFPSVLFLACVGSAYTFFGGTEPPVHILTIASRLLGNWPAHLNPMTSLLSLIYLRRSRFPLFISFTHLRLVFACNRRNYQLEISTILSWRLAFESIKKSKREYLNKRIQVPNYLLEYKASICAKIKCYVCQWLIKF